MGNQLPTVEAPRQVKQSFPHVPSVREIDKRDVVAAEAAVQQAVRAEMVYAQQVALRQSYLQKCVRATGVNHYEDCREDAVTLMRYLSYYNNIDMTNEWPTEADIARRHANLAQA